MSSKEKRHRRDSRDRSPYSSDRHRRRDKDEGRHFEKLRVKIKEEPRDDDDRTERHRHERMPREEESRRKRRKSNSPGQTFEWGKHPADALKKDIKTEEEEKPKEKPNFGLSGNLAKDTNTFNGVVVKYSEPSEARKPKLHWRLYPFKGSEELPFIPIHRQSAYLLGRDRRVADIPVDHPSCSKQHAVLQYRFIKRTLDDGTVSRRVRPYIIDLDSGNGTFVNNQKIEPQRYYELFEKDVIKFGFSSRDYVLLHEGSQEEANDSDGAGPVEDTTKESKSPL